MLKMPFRIIVIPSKILYLVILILEMCFCESLISGTYYTAKILKPSRKLLNSCIFPESLSLKVQAPRNGRIITVFLRKNNLLNNDIPLYYIQNTTVGITLIAESLTARKHTTYYQSPENNGFISVRCSKKSGIVSFDGVIESSNGVQAFVETDLKDTNNGKRNATPVLKQYDIPLSTPTDTLYHDYIGTDTSYIPDITMHNFTKKPSKRSVRDIMGSVTSYTVDVLVVVDYSIFRRWFQRHYDPSSVDSRVENTKLEIKDYYSQVINGVDLRYKNIRLSDFDIQVKPVGFVIADDRNAFPWTETGRITQRTRGQMNANDALKKFRDWLNVTEGLPDRDHAIFFTMHDLYTIDKMDKTKIKHTSGLAFIGTLCQYGDSVSIVEEQGGFQSVGTTAHEIGHSLGARHDGEGNPCRSQDRFIMAASGFGPVPHAKRYNPWQFSECTVEYFRNFIVSLIANGTNCLINSTHGASKHQELSMPGQIYNPDEQCRLIWGLSSYLCRGSEFGNTGDICTGLYCRDPSTATDCVHHIAARGTSCGDNKWCIEGKCIYSANAPHFKDTCILGDQPGAAFNDMSCDDLMYQSPSYCYQDKVRARCCKSCQKHYTWRKGCEYGDRVQGCKAWHCHHNFGTRNILVDCCSTCNVGDVIHPSVRPFMNTERDTTIMPSEECTDVGLTGHRKCEELISDKGKYVCYNQAISQNCCFTCKTLSDTARQGCEYGDRSPTLCTRISNVTTLYCSKYEKQCCTTCIRQLNSANTNRQFISLYVWLFINLIYESVVT